MGGGRRERAGSAIVPQAGEGPTPAPRKTDNTGLLSMGLFSDGKSQDMPESGTATRPPGADIDSPEVDAALHGPNPGEKSRRSRSGVRPEVSRRGRQAGVLPVARGPGNGARDVDWSATIRAAAPYQARRRHPRGLTISLLADELLQRRRVQAPEHLLLFVVDASGSMGGKQTAAAGQVAARTLRRAYLDRRRVGMIAFRAKGAELLFRPTSRPEQIHRALAALALGGTTPLGRGIDLAARTVRARSSSHPGEHSTVILITDGRANVGPRLGYESAVADVEEASRQLVALRDTRVVLLDTTEAGKDDRPAQWLAEQLRAERIQLSGLSANSHAPKQ